MLTSAIVDISRKKRLTFLLVTAILGLVIALVIAEVGLRMTGFEFGFYPTRVQFGYPDPISLRKRFVVDRDLLWVPPDYAETITRWRGKRPDIVFMGCSCTQFGRYPEMVEAHLEKNSDFIDVATVNAGVSGWSTYQGLAQLRRDVLPMHPRIITVYYGWNDHWSSFGIEDKAIGRHNLEHPDWFLDLKKHSRVLQLISKAYFGLVISRTGARPKRVSLDDFETNLRKIVEEAREHGVEPILMTAPTAYRPGDQPLYLADRWIDDLGELVPLHARYADVVRRVAQTENAVLVDLHAEFDAFDEDRIAGCFTKDGIHLSEKGSAHVADLLVRKMTDSGLVARLGLDRQNPAVDTDEIGP